MKLTNSHGLPAAFVHAAGAFMSSHRPTPGRMSVTDLMKPVQVRCLEAHHWDEIEEDAIERLWAVFGSIAHQILQGHASQNSLAEEKLQMEIDGVTLVGIADLYEEPGTISDWKVTSVYAVRNVKVEWETQLNAYALLYRAAGMPVEQLQIHAILRDWSKSKARRERGYPPRAFVSLSVPVWPDVKLMAVVHDRLGQHECAMRAGKYPPCTMEERWAKPDQWAVHIGKRKRALKVCATEAQAYAIASAVQAKGKASHVDFRPGESVRCADYCRVSSFCLQWGAMRSTEVGNEREDGKGVGTGGGST